MLSIRRSTTSSSTKSSRAADPLPLPWEREPHARGGVRAPRFDEPRLKWQGQGVPLLRHAIAAHAVEPRGEPRIRRRDRLGGGSPRGPSLHAHRPSESLVHRCGICSLWTTFFRPVLPYERGGIVP